MVKTVNINEKWFDCKLSELGGLNLEGLACTIEIQIIDY